MLLYGVLDKVIGKGLTVPVQHLNFTASITSLPSLLCHNCLPKFHHVWVAMGNCKGMCSEGMIWEEKKNSVSSKEFGGQNNVWSSLTHIQST